jgi:hypothetical protein
MSTHASITTALAELEGDCLGVDAKVPRQLHADVVAAADKALTRHAQTFVSCDAPRYVGFGLPPYALRQGASAQEVADARAALDAEMGQSGGPTGEVAMARGGAQPDIKTTVETLLRNFTTTAMQ